MSRMQNVTQTTLHNLRSFVFVGVSAYLKALISYMNAPLEMLSVTFFNQLSFSVPHLCQFLTTTEDLRSSKVKFLFYHKGVVVFIYPSMSTRVHTHDIGVGCELLDWQVSAMAQIFNVLGTLLSAVVVDLPLDYRAHTLSPEWHNQADPIQWRELLGSFRNVETLRVHEGLVGELSHCLALDEGPPSGILPKLKTLVYPVGSRHDETFAAFVHGREVAGLPTSSKTFLQPEKLSTNSKLRLAWNILVEVSSSAISTRRRTWRIAIRRPTAKPRT